MVKLLAVHIYHCFRGSARTAIEHTPAVADAESTMHQLLLQALVLPLHQTLTPVLTA